MKRLFLLRTLLALLLACQGSAFADPASGEPSLEQQLRPFIALISEPQPFDLHLRADLDVGEIDARLTRRGEDSFSLRMTHADYAFEMHRDVESLLLMLPKHRRVMVARGQVDGPDHLSPRGFLDRVVSDQTSALVYLQMITAADEQGAAMLARNLLGLRFDGSAWTSSNASDLTVTFSEAGDAMTVATPDATVTLRLKDPDQVPAMPARSDIPTDWTVTELPRVEMERAFARGVRRAFEVLAPSAKLTDPVREPRRVEHGELRWVEDQRLVILEGSPREVGRAHGQLLRDEAQRCFDSVLYYFGVANTIRTGDWFLNDLRDAYARLAPHIPEHHKAEINALADAMNLPREHVQLVGVFPELFHCSGFAVFGSATQDGKLYHGRVLDYMTMIGLQQSAVTFLVMLDGKHAFMNVGYAGFTGSVTGMNEKQVSLGEMGGGGVGQWDGVPMATLMRLALEDCSTLDDVKQLWRDAPRTCEYFYVFADGKIPDAVGVAATPQQIDFVESGASHEWLGEGITDAVVLSAGHRLEVLRRRVKQGFGTIDAPAAMRLMDRPVAMSSNLHNALFVPQDLILYVAQANDSEIAARRPYVKFDFGQLLKERRQSGPIPSR